MTEGEWGKQSQTLGLVDKSSAPSLKKYPWQETDKDWGKERLQGLELKQREGVGRILEFPLLPLGDLPLGECPHDDFPLTKQPPLDFLGKEVL